MKIFNFLNVKNSKESLTKENLYDFLLAKEYKKNQEVVFWSVFIAYLVYYLTRKEWTIFGTILKDEKVINDSQYALIGFIFSIVYGFSKFINAPISDKKSNRWLLGLGLIGAGILNILLGVTWINIINIFTPIVISCVLMILIGWFHSLGAIPCTRFFYNWFNHKERRNRNIVWNVSHNIGSALAGFVATGSYTLFSDLLHNNLAYFILPSIISIVCGVIVILLIKESPQTVGLPSIQNYYNIKLIGGEKENKKSEVEKPWKYYFIKYVLKNKYVWCLAIANMLMYTVRMGISDWSLGYFKDVYNYDIKEEGKWIYSMIDWGGVFFTLIIGLIANKYLKRFALFNIIMIIVATLAILGVWLSKGSFSLLVTFMLLAGVIYIPQCFLTVMANEISHHKVISTSTGVMGVFAYIGDGLSKVLIGTGLIKLGWNAVFIFLIICGFLASVMLLPMLKKNSVN